MMQWVKKPTQTTGSRKYHLIKLELIDFLSVAKRENLRASHDEKYLDIIVAEIRELIANATEAGFLKLRKRRKAKAATLSLKTKRTPQSW